MGLRSWKFENGDLDFIQEYYPDLYDVLEPTISSDRRSVVMLNKQQWDKTEDLFVDEIASSAGDHGDLNENGLRLESILDFA